MSTLKSYQDLEVWKKSIDLAEMVYRISTQFPTEEKFGLTSQIRRAAVSVPANIAEGAARKGTGEFLQFLSMASGSLAETETFLILAERLHMLTSEQTHPVQQQAADVGRMLNGLKRSLPSKS
ncbi:MAG: four helix bundle protein [Candidatus Methylomirabilis oxyfera]|nr:four helix bundle protein [Candidatus Methylomirabilis oxyfera]